RAASRGDRCVSGALCPRVNLVPGVCGDLLGGAPRRVPVWEIAGSFQLPRSWPLAYPFLFYSCGGRHDATQAAASWSAPVARALAGDAPARRRHRRPRSGPLGGRATRGCAAATAGPPAPLARARALLRRLYGGLAAARRLADRLRRDDRRHGIDRHLLDPAL